MRYTIGAIITGNEKVVEYYKTAQDKWREFFDDTARPEAEWPDWLAEQQDAFFDKECGGNLLGHEVMAISLFGTLFSTQLGWEAEKRALAEKAMKAIAASRCSDRVKTAVQDAARCYRIDDASESAPA